MKFIKKLVKVLNAETAPSEVAAGVILGAVIGLTPTFSLHNLIVVALVIVLKVNISSAIFSAMLFGVLGYAVDGVSHQLGRYLLLTGGLEGLWTFFYNTPLLALARFHNTVVLGSVLVSLLIMYPLYVYSKKFIVYYRANLQHRVAKMKIVKMLKASKLVKLYRRVKI